MNVIDNYIIWAI